MVVLTAYGDADSVKSCYDAGVSTFLKKPFNLFEIRGVVRNAIAVKQLSTHLDEMVQERTTELEQQLNEITALNRFFQRRLEWRSKLDARYKEALDEMQKLATEISTLARSVQAWQFTDLPDLPTLESEDLGTNEHE